MTDMLILFLFVLVVLFASVRPRPRARGRSNRAVAEINTFARVGARGWHRVAIAALFLLSLAAGISLIYWQNS